MLFRSEKKLYKSLNVPISRLEPNQGFSIGRVAEVTRDELKFSKFVDRLRNKFAELFDQALRVQCILKGICTAEEWDSFKEQIYFDFIQDNNFTEMKEAELMKERLGLLMQIDPYTGRYYSQTWVQRNVLRMTDDEIKSMQEEIDEEKAMGLGLPTDVTNAVAQQQMMGDVENEQQASMAQFNSNLQLQQQKKQMEMMPPVPPPSDSKPKPQKEETSGTFSKIKKIL